jgi:hypothetical protein
MNTGSQASLKHPDLELVAPGAPHYSNPVQPQLWLKTDIMLNKRQGSWESEELDKAC